MNGNHNSSSQQALHFFIELRSRVLYSVVVLVLLFAVFMFYANQLYTLLALPLLQYLPQGHLIATQLVSPFFVPFKLAFMAAMLLAVPFFLYQCWAFIAPALYGHEKRMIWPFLLVSAVLFYAGIAFAYFIIFPMLFKFLANVAPKGVILSPDIGEYLSFTTNLLLIFGGLFEIPIIMVLLVSAGIVSLAKLISMRSYAIVGAFIVGMLIAPPDVLSQTILAIPIWMLYEVGIVMSRLVGVRSNGKEVQSKSG
jgi:sec-independent protein translocase protein TatC